MDTRDTSQERKPRGGAYLASLPERALRSAAALMGGALYEGTEVLLPAWLRNTVLYKATVARLLRLTIELLGGVPGVYPAGDMEIQELAVRKTLGNVVEVAGFLAVGWSPLWVLAAAADLTGGARVYLRALVEELKRDGLLPADAELRTVDELLNALEGTTEVLAEAVDVPPLRVEDMRRSWQTLKRNAADLPQADELAAIYSQLLSLSRREGRSLRSLSALIALDALRAGVGMGNSYLFEYYRQALRSIQHEGFPAYMRRVVQPYLHAARRHFHPTQETFSERMLRRVLHKARGGRPNA